ncbi:hypothetical protein [Staphylococcus xylosus]|uniref:hypothetical protein n=1 Tax=Staphylococcus xylosus TaxID=1288 RepID=UPI000A5656D7|nr:hypothetical protein [Staphylococcus xylosus]MCD8850968.1 hypothetical protein [Staphylococcus xylosus]
MGEIVLINEISFIPFLITSGVLGFLSFTLFAKMGKIYSSDNVEKTLSITFLSFINFIIFWILILIFNIYIDSLEVVILFGIITTIVISIIYPFLITKNVFIKLNEYINNSRTNQGNSMQHSQPVRELVFDKNKTTIIYIFSFENTLINCGYVANINTKNSDPLEVSIVPFNQENTLKNFEEVQNYIESKEIKSNIIVNLEAGFQMILIEN